MGIFFLVQTLMANFISPEADDAPAKQAKKNFSYEEAVEQQKREGGPRRFYGDDELDIESARIADEHGNPVTPSQQSASGEVSREISKQPTGRDYIHVNVAYCIS